MIVIGDTIPQIASADRREAARARVEPLFKQQSMKAAACFAASVHEAAADYIEQAPVLAIAVLAGGGKLAGGRANAAYAAHKFGGLCARGAKLREVLAAYRLTAPMRKLKAKALTIEDELLLHDLAAVPPSTLSQIVPNSITAQRRWLAAIHAYRGRTRWQGLRWTSQRCPEWAMVQMARHGVATGAAEEVADFAMRGDVAINPAWEWPRAMVAAQDWHARLSAGDAKAKYGVMADQIVDLGGHPDHAVIDGYEFVALRTPIAIHAEGSSMSHCVGSYISSVINGWCSIVSVRHDERRVATMQLTDGRVSQLKGRFNATPSAAVIAAARAYGAALKRKGAA